MLSGCLGGDLRLTAIRRCQCLNVEVLITHCGPKTLHCYEWTILISMSANKEHGAGALVFLTGNHFVFRSKISKT